MTITPQQIKTIHTLLQKTGQMEEKPGIVHAFTNGRSQSSKDLTIDEAEMMIKTLRQFDKEDAANKMRKKIISLAYEMHWAKAGEWKAAVAAIDKFCEGTRGMFKKKLNGHSVKELVQVVSQFEMMYKKHLRKI